MYVCCEWHDGYRQERWDWQEVFKFLLRLFEFTRKDTNLPLLPPTGSLYLPTPYTTWKIQENVSILVEYRWFEFRVFRLLPSKEPSLPCYLPIARKEMMESGIHKGTNMNSFVKSPVQYLTLLHQVNFLQQ